MTEAGVLITLLKEESAWTEIVLIRLSEAW